LHQQSSEAAGKHLRQCLKEKTGETEIPKPLGEADCFFPYKKFPRSAAK
jgi:hypothetical protein